MLPQAKPVTVTVYDITGEEIDILVDEFQAAGKHSIIYNSSILSSGIYLYKIQAGNFTRVKKMIVLK